MDHSHARKRSWGSSVQDNANLQIESRVDCSVKKHQTVPPPITSAASSYTTAYLNPVPPILDSHLMARETAIPQSATNAARPHSQGHTRPAGLGRDDEDSVMMDLNVLLENEALGGSMGHLGVDQGPKTSTWNPTVPRLRINHAASTRWAIGATARSVS